MFTGHKLALMLAFTVLVALAFGVSCRGFFPKPVLQSIAIQPPTPQVPFNGTLTLQAWGTYDNGNRQQITSGVAWSSTANVSITTDTGVATGVNLGTATITAAAQGLSNTAAATVYLANISNLAVNPATWTVSGTNSGNMDFTATATANGAPVDVTTGATWTVSPTPALGTFTCTNSGASPETCTVTTGTTAGSYRITVTYPGTTLAPFVAVTVN
jgi:hypothetical protein